MKGNHDAALEPNTRPLFIVDPYLKTPETEACSFLEKETQTLASTLEKRGRRPYPIPNVLTFFPAQEGTDILQDALREHTPFAVVCLGSFANLNENRPWVPRLGHCLLTQVASKNIPLFGICFAHQLLAHSSGEWDVRPVPRERLPPAGRWEGSRQIYTVHPKMRLLFTRFEEGDRASGSLMDKEFRWCVQETNSWTAERWQSVFHNLPSSNSPQENRVRAFVEEHCPTHLESVAAHEQEVVAKGGGVAHGSQTFLLAAQSDECACEGLVHSTMSTYTLQTHPERAHTSQRLVSNFLYLSFLRSAC